MLKGKAKTDYQRNYMRKRRATIRPIKGVRPNLKLLDLLDQTLDDCRGGLATVNKNLIEVQRIVEAEDKAIESVCPACGGLGYRELDKAGLIRVPCKECRK